MFYKRDRLFEKKWRHVRHRRAAGSVSFVWPHRFLRGVPRIYPPFADSPPIGRPRVTCPVNMASARALPRSAHAPRPCVRRSVCALYSRPRRLLSPVARCSFSPASVCPTVFFFFPQRPTVIIFPHISFSFA